MRKKIMSLDDHKAAANELWNIQEAAERLLNVLNGKVPVALLDRVAPFCNSYAGVFGRLRTTLDVHHRRISGVEGYYYGKRPVRGVR